MEEEPKEEKEDFIFTFIELDDENQLQMPEGVMVVPIKTYKDFINCVGALMRSAENRELIFYYNKTFIYHFSHGGVAYTKLQEHELNDIEKFKKGIQKEWETQQQKEKEQQQEKDANNSY